MSDSTYKQELAQLTALQELTGENTTARGRFQVESEQTRLLGLLAVGGLGGVVDSSPPEPEPEPLPPIEENGPEPEPVEPVIIAEDVFFYDPSAYSPSRKPRLSAAGSPDYFPAAVLGNLTGQARYHGIVFQNIQETMAFRRVEVPLRRANVLGGERASLLFLRKEGAAWVMRMRRDITLLKNHARIIWAREFIFPAGETWAVVTGLREGPERLDIFYGNNTPYPAPAANTTLSSNDLLQQGVNVSAPVTQGAGTHRCIRFYGVNVPKDVIGPLSPEDLPPGVGGVSFDVPFSFNADAPGYYIAKRAVTLGTPQVGGSGTVAYALSTTGTFSPATFPLTMAAGNILRVTVTGLTSGQFAAVNTVATVL